MPSTTPSYTIPQVAALTRTSREHIQRKVTSGEIQSYKIGHSRRIPAEAVDALMGTTPDVRNDLDAYIQELIDAAPKLSARQLNRLACIIGGSK